VVGGGGAVHHSSFPEPGEPGRYSKSRLVRSLDFVVEQTRKRRVGEQQAGGQEVEQSIKSRTTNSAVGYKNGGKDAGLWSVGLAVAGFDEDQKPR